MKHYLLIGAAIAALAFASFAAVAADNAPALTQALPPASVAMAAQPEHDVTVCALAVVEDRTTCTFDVVADAVNCSPDLSPMLTAIGAPLLASPGYLADCLGSAPRPLGNGPPS